MRQNFSLCLRGSLSRACGLFFAVMLWPFLVHAQSADDGFKPNIGPGTEQFPGVYAIAVQDDGKILIGGAFASVGGQTRNRLARVNVDGSLDMTFVATDVDGYVGQIVMQSDHRIIITGPFDQVGTYARHRIARLNADGRSGRSTRPV